MLHRGILRGDASEDLDGMTAERPDTTPESPPPTSDDPSQLPTINLGPHFEMHPVVFPAGALIVIGLVLSVFLFPSEDVASTFGSIRAWIGSRFGWLYVASMTGFLLLTLWLAFSKFGAIRLGRDGEKPEFGRLSWFAMLFSAGMGIGLMFWSVAEPINHYTTPPPGFADGLDPSRVSMAVTIFHWGLHPWALYAFVGLALAYFGFRHDKPLGFRSLLHPIFGDRVYGRLGDVVDTLAIIATLTGVATSLGIGAQQVNAGLAFLFGVPMGTTVQILLIAGITAVATVSVVMGLAKGIRRLSELNMVMAALLMVLVILASGVVAFLGSVVENTGSYLQLLPFSSFRTGAMNAEGRSWLNGWTVFYWAWWISWSPFVGMFIARISRGRTVREFLIGTLVVPTLVGIVWLTAFGSTTLRDHTEHLKRAADESYVDGSDLPVYTVALTDGDDHPIESADGGYETEQEHLTAVEFLTAPVTTEDGSELVGGTETVLFALLREVFKGGPLLTLAAGIATLCVILFFVTSSDSASMVIDIIASGGNPDPPVGTRLFWAIAEGGVAATLLVAGGLGALQAASIAAALPFTFVLLLTGVALFKALSKEGLA